MMYQVLLRRQEKNKYQNFLIMASKYFHRYHLFIIFNFLSKVQRILYIECNIDIMRLSNKLSIHKYFELCDVFLTQDQVWVESDIPREFFWHSISWFIPVTIPNAIYNEAMIMITGFGMLCKYIVINRNRV